MLKFPHISETEDLRRTLGTNKIYKHLTYYGLLQEFSSGVHCTLKGAMRH